ncbi:hypothetical protein BKA62DRAFT_82242 [Auriculariales sp. MPI-PUGE-AT-0066]|nr:hypothetical protein BKA62DRAFT_82242 [Auriculariales sp. MPI-PUGE-AT-0066]
MGQAVSMINKTLGNDETKKTMDDAVMGLKATADAKVDMFYESIEAGQDSKLIPINRVVSKFRFTQCKVSQDAKTLKGEINGLIKDLAGGNWADAISDSATGIIQGMLGESTTSIQERTSYCVAMDPMGGIYRLDAYYLSYTFTAKALLDSVSNFIAVCVVKSSVDMRGLDDDSLRIIVNDSFSSISNDRKALLLEQVQIALLPTPPTDKQIQATAAIAKFWSENVQSAQVQSQALLASAKVNGA